MSSHNDDLWIETDTGALRANYRLLSQKLGGKKGVMPVIKANGYGHGLLTVARALALENAPCLAVSHLGEGRILRQGGIELPVLLMIAPLPEHYPEIVAQKLTPAVDRREALAALSAAAGDGTAEFQLKLNTGMNRLGLEPAALDDFLAELARRPNLRLTGVFSHLACAMKANDPATKKQIEIFDAAVKKLRAALPYTFDAHLANSAGALTEPSAHYDYTRIGTLLYGQWPAPHLRNSLMLQPTWRVQSRIVSVRELKKGDRVGYGGDYTCRRDLRAGVIPVGYTDGFGTQTPLNNVTFGRFCRNTAKLLRSFLRGRPTNYVYYRGQPLPVLGRIAMQSMVVDLSGCDAAVGDTVTLPLRRTATDNTLVVRETVLDSK